MSLYKVEVRRIIKIIRKDKSLPEQNSISGSENIARKGTPQCLRLSAVFTLEAAVVMPVLACFFVSVLFFFRIMQIQLEVQKALDDTGRKLAVCAAAVSSDGAALPGIAEALLLREMADRTEAETYITGGKFGISLIGSDFSGEEITLRAAYHIRLLYITNQGDCYHKDLGCSGIKRTVRMIRLSEVGTRRPCSRCGQ